MKILVTFFFVLFTSSVGYAQVNDTIPPYEQVPFVPPFKIQLADSSWFTKANLVSKRPTWVIYFSPDCGHCQLETEEIISNISKLKKLQIVMITSRPFEDMKNFSDHYMLHKFPGIKIGVDPARFITHFYKVETTPFSAFYDKKGKLIKAYKKGADFKEILDMIN